MKEILLLNKREGETPLYALGVFRENHQAYKDTKMTYAGRLDPMASGLLLVLAGEKIKDKEKYLNLDKEYEFEILFGFATDTHDILGKVIKQDPTTKLSVEDLRKEIQKNIKSFLGESIQKYPAYSSKTVKGRPLFSYARAGEKVDAPQRNIFIKKLKLEKIREIDKKILLKNIENRIAKVNGDFRQAEILKIWKKNLLASRNQGKFKIGSFKIKCSSGTYVRVLANTLGDRLKIPALAFSIKRTKIGKYMLQ